MKNVLACAISCLMEIHGFTLHAQVIDWQAKPMTKDRVAEFSIWIPQNIATIKSLIVLSPGYAGDGRGMAKEADWQALAERTHSALLGCHFKGSQEGYYWGQSWPVDCLEQALKEFSLKSSHPEICTVPLVLWGHSAGGAISYLIARTLPTRTLAFVVNKSDVGLDRPMPRQGSNIPALIFMGEIDTQQRNTGITGFYEHYRCQGAPWGMVVEPGVGHGIGVSKVMAQIFFESIIPLRLDTEGNLREINPKTGWLGDRQTHEIHEPGNTAMDSVEHTSWFPDYTVAKYWQNVVSQKSNY